MATEKLVLVVDDEEDVRMFLAAILEDAGFAVVTAGDGDHALEEVKRRAPDLISLDLVMPGRSGIRFLHALRRDHELSKIPVLVVTGHARDSLGKKDLDDILSGKMISGPEVYLEKPVTPESYVRAVRRQMREPDTAAPAAAPGDASPGEAAELSRLLEDASEETRREILRLLREKGEKA